MPKLEEVFGISTQPVLSYVTRADVDGRFIGALKSPHHLVIYGASKQGKTALRQKHIGDGQCEIYRCNPNTTPQAIYQHILRAANVRIETTQSKQDSTAIGGKLSGGIKAAIPWLYEAKGATEASTTTGQQMTMVTEFVDVNLNDSQTVASMLQAAQFTKFVILENFHYLSEDVQRALSFDLKTFHEMSIRFILLGVWRESNHLLGHNPDLQDRMTEIPVEPWNEVDFDRVIDAGQDHLNIEIPNTARIEFKRHSYGNVGMVQEFLKTYCKLNGVDETQMQSRILNETDLVLKTIELKANDQRGRLLTVLEGISAKSRGDRRQGGGEPLTLPYYLVQVLLTAPVSELNDGISRKHLHDRIRELHRRQDKETIRTSDVVHLLKRLPFLQDKSLSPFLYWDSNQQRLRIVDAGLLFALAQCDRIALLEEILDPLATYDDDAPEEASPNDERDLFEDLDDLDA